MSPRIRVGVMGAGAVGCYVGGRLAAADEADVVFVGREALQSQLRGTGLTVRDFGGAGQTVAGSDLTFETEPACLAECDVILCCVKSRQSAEVGVALASVLPRDAIVVSLQNGLRNASTLRDELGDRLVLAGIVGFNVIWQDGGSFQKSTSGPLTVEACTDPRVLELARALRASGIEYLSREDIAPDQWTKLLLNLNNSVSALSGAPTRDLVLVPEYRRILTEIMSEGMRAIRAAGIHPARMNGMPVELVLRALRLPTFLVRLVARAQMKIDPDARSSMHEDLRRTRLTEVDYLNGEIVALAARVGGEAPLNQRIVELVHEAEAAGNGSPKLSADELWARLHS